MMSKVIMFILGIVVGAGFMVGMDYLEAKDELDYCVEAEQVGCQIEYDGLIGGFNIYWKGE